MQLTDQDQKEIKKYKRHLSHIEEQLSLFDVFNGVEFDDDYKILFQEYLVLANKALDGAGVPAKIEGQVVSTDDAGSTIQVYATWDKSYSQFMAKYGILLVSE